MSSQFSTTGAGASTPAVCIPTLVPPPPGYIDGWPIGLDAFGSWWSDYTIDPIADTFRLTRDLGLPGWSGESGNTGRNLKASVTFWPSPGLYRCNLTFRIGTSIIASHNWYNVPVDPPPPFDTGLLWYRGGVPIEIIQLQVQG